ncbi:hypothetical protein BCV70DRAFT_197701 [Testicularia cyperi]|uniref:Uncharacterized protein n=1 Tax=Testicularia cyperi TaxID=1882483 RepID=A0A317XYW3_9BASI|nr:hypothetical protein BCV70DRAFT_197701 [Testicularia cyperi]
MVYSRVLRSALWLLAASAWRKRKHKLGHGSVSFMGGLTAASGGKLDPRLTAAPSTAPVRLPWKDEVREHHRYPTCSILELVNDMDI